MAFGSPYEAHRFRSFRERAMSMTILKYTFEGPFDSVSKLKRKPGAFVVFGTRRRNNLKGVLDAGVSGDVRAKVESHKNRESWASSGYDGLEYAAYYGDKSRASIIAGEIVTILQPDYTDFEVRILD